MTVETSFRESIYECTKFCKNSLCVTFAQQWPEWEYFVYKRDTEQKQREISCKNLQTQTNESSRSRKLKRSAAAASGDHQCYQLHWHLLSSLPCHRRTKSARAVALWLPCFLFDQWHHCRSQAWAGTERERESERLAGRACSQLVQSRNQEDSGNRI